MNNPHLSSPHPLSGLSELEALAARFLATAQYDSTSPARAGPFGSYEAQEEVRDALARYLKMAAHTSGSGQPPPSFPPPTTAAPLMPSASSTPVIMSTSTYEESSPAGSRASSKAREGGKVAGGLIHEVEVVKSRGTRQIKCSECPQVLLSRRNFIKHAEDEHGLVLPIINRSFDSQIDFDRWISQLREDEGTEFVSKCGRKKLSNGSLLGYLVCMRGGCASIKEGVHRKKKTGKSLKTCSAFLKVLQNVESGQITVEGCLTHTGHVQNGCSNQPLMTTPVNRHEGGAPEELSQGEEPLIEVVDDDDGQQLMTAEGGSAFTRVVTQTSNIVEQHHPVYRPPRHTPLPTMVIDERIQIQSTPATPLNKRKRPKEEVVSSNIMEPHNTTPATHQPITTIADDSLHVRRAPYVDVGLERRKLAMLEKFQTTLQRVDSHTIDAAEVATNFFVREMDMLSKGAHHMADVREFRGSE